MRLIPARPGFLVALFCLCVSSLPALEPPRPGELDQLIKDGTFAKREAFSKRLGNHKVRPDVARRSMARLNALASGNRVPQEILPAWQGMPTTGTNNVLVFMIEFPDYPHGNDASTISNALFGAGNPADYPTDSLRNYYIRSSYSNLWLQGSALGWYQMQHERSWYTNAYGDGNEANRAVIDEVVQHFDATHDFSQYDNNGDGDIDYFAVIWTGPDTGWSGFWWGYQWSLDTPILADGVNFKSFSWQWEANPVGSEYSAYVICHETGHALGLPDYYDYQTGLGPEGGLGGLDMMDGIACDHNAFSKFMLEWLTPTFVSGASTSVTLMASAAYPSAAAVMPGYAGPHPFEEYFVVQNRDRVLNDTNAPGTGLLVWHVDATPNGGGSDFLYNNSYTEHKLLRLMEADGLEEIEALVDANAGDYYNQGESFLPYGTPNSQTYGGSNTWVSVRNISPDGVTMTADLSAEAIPGMMILERLPSSLSQYTVSGIGGTNQDFQVRVSGGSCDYTISDDASWLSVVPASGTSSNSWNTHALHYDTAGLAAGSYAATITISSTGTVNTSLTLGVTLSITDTNLVAALDATNLTWLSGGSLPWVSQAVVTHDGVDAAQSGAIGNEQNTWLQTTVEGPGALQFWWSASSEDGYDFLSFSVDRTNHLMSISGETDWQQVAHMLPAGTHTCLWVYAKDELAVGGSDAGWVDLVSFIAGSNLQFVGCSVAGATQAMSTGSAPVTVALEVFNEGSGTMPYSIADDVPWLSVTAASGSSSGATNLHAVRFDASGLAIGAYMGQITLTATSAVIPSTTIPVRLDVLAPQPTLGDAVDAPSLVWISGGNLPWFRQTTNTHDGADAAQAGDISDLQESWIQTTVQGPGALRYWMQTSSEENYDYLDVYLDDTNQNLSLSGITAWQQQTLIIPDGSHRVRWTYSKDTSWAEGSDTAWLDEVSFVAAPEIGTAGTSSGGGSLSLSWPATNGYYTLQYSTNLLLGQWTIAPGWTTNTPAAGEMMTYTNVLPYPFAAFRLIWNP
jgi:M6 family metalloprotease-like protein